MIQKKVLNISHIDLDGAASSICVNNVFTNVTNVNISANYGLRKWINQMVTNPFILNNYELLIITDLGFDTTMLFDLLGALQVCNYKGDFLLLDHHESSLPIHDPEIGIIVNTKMCGAKLTQLTLSKQFGVDLSHLDELIKFTNDYDLWIHTYPESKHLNILLNNYIERSTVSEGIKAFIEIYHKGFFYNKMTKLELLIIAQQLELINKAYDNLEIIELHNSKIVFALLHGSLVNDMAHKVFKNSDYKIFISYQPGKINASIRTSADCKINLSTILPLLEKTLNIRGGGHKHAGGFSMEALSYKMPKDQQLVIAQEVIEKLSEFFIIGDLSLKR